MKNAPDFQLHYDAFGRLQFIGADGETQGSVVAVRAFPISAPDRGIALVDPHGHELAWIEQLSDLPEDLQMRVQGELDSREFMPVIRRIVSVSSYATPSTWRVITDHGDTDLVLKGEEDIWVHRLPSRGHQKQ